MKQPTPKDVRHAVILAVIITVVVMFALFDPSCQPREPESHPGPSRSIAPR